MNLKNFSGKQLDKDVGEKFIVGCRGVVQQGVQYLGKTGKVPPRWGLVSSVLFTIVHMSYKIRNIWLILLSHFILPHFASVLYATFSQVEMMSPKW